MRIGMILDKTFPPDPRVENEAIALVEANHEVFLFCLKYNKEADVEDYLGINICRYLSNRIEYKLSALAYTIPLYSQLMKRKISTFLKSNRVEVIHIHDIRIADAVFKANKKIKLPVVLDLHDNFPEIMKTYPHLQKFPGRLLISPKKWKIKEEGFIKISDRVITVSNEFIEEVVERTKVDREKIVLVPNTVRQSFYKHAIINENLVRRYNSDFVVLYLGDTGLRRGLLTAIESIAKLKDEIKNIKLVIVGSNSTDTVLRQSVKELGISKYVDFEGWQDVSLFASYIVSSSVCISPLNRNVQHDVAYANKLFQYMSFGKPVLVSDATAQKNLIQKTKSGLVHMEQDAEDFSNKLLELYNDKNLRSLLGANGKKFIEEEFCWEKVSNNLITLYRNLR